MLSAGPRALLLALALATAGCEEGVGELCTPGAARACYDGPAGTLGVGTCREGKATCLPDGDGYGPCAGEVLPAAQVCGSTADQACTGTSGCPGLVEWAESFGDAYAQSADLAAPYGTDGVLVAGQLDGSVGFGHGVVVSATGDPGAFLAAFDGSGALVWIRLLAAPGGGTVVSSVFEDADGGVLAAGWFQGATDLGLGPVEGAADGSADAFLLALDRRGDVRWQRIFGGPGDQRAWISPADADGGHVLTAVYSGTLDLGDVVLTSALSDPTMPDLAVVRLDAATEVVWTRSATGGFQPLLDDGYVSPAPAVVAGDGTVLVAAGVGDQFEIAGSVVALGEDQEPVTLAAAYDGAGDFQWSQVFMDPFDDPMLPGSVAAGSDGNVWVMTGLTRPTAWPLPDISNTISLTATQLTTGGVELLHMATVSSVGGDLTVDGAGNLVMAITMSGSGIAPSDLTVSKVDPTTGANIWTNDLGGGADARVTVDAAGGVRFVGTFVGMVTVGGFMLTATAAVPGSNEPDVFLARTLP